MSEVREKLKKLRRASVQFHEEHCIKGTLREHVHNQFSQGIKDHLEKLENQAEDTSRSVTTIEAKQSTSKELLLEEKGAAKSSRMEVNTNYKMSSSVSHTKDNGDEGMFNNFLAEKIKFLSENTADHSSVENPFDPAGKPSSEQDNSSQENENSTVVNHKGRNLGDPVEEDEKNCNIDEGDVPFYSNIEARYAGAKSTSTTMTLSPLNHRTINAAFNTPKAVESQELESVRLPVIKEDDILQTQKSGKVLRSNLRSDPKGFELSRGLSQKPHHLLQNTTNEVQRHPKEAATFNPKNLDKSESLKSVDNDVGQSISTSSKNMEDNVSCHEGAGIMKYDEAMAYYSARSGKVNETSDVPMKHYGSNKSYTRFQASNTAQGHKVENTPITSSGKSETEFERRKMEILNRIYKGNIPKFQKPPQPSIEDGKMHFLFVTCRRLPQVASKPYIHNLIPNSLDFIFS